MQIFEENGIKIPDIRELKESEDRHISLSKFAKFLDKIFMQNIDSRSCVLYSRFILDYYITIDFTIFKYTIPTYIAKKLSECKGDKNIRFYVIPILLKFSDNIVHANVLIVDNDSKTIELYEPYGEGYESKHVIFDSTYHIKNLISIILASRSDYTFKNVHNICPIGFQRKQDTLGNIPSRHCGAWSLFFIHIRLYNIDKPTSDIIKHFDSYTPEYLNSFIKKYITLIKKESQDVEKFYSEVNYPIKLTPNEETKAKLLIAEKLKLYLDNMKYNIGGVEIYNVKNLIKEIAIYSQFDFFNKIFFDIINKN